MTHETTDTAHKKLFKNTSEESAQTELDACMAAQAEWKEKCMRVSADLANLNKRIVKERAQWAHAAQSELLLPLLTILDDFDRAAQTEELSEGMKMIHTAFNEYLKNAGVTEISYEQFDPELHEALLHVNAEGKKEGDVVEVMQKGYKLGDIIIRPAKVSVAK